MKSGTLRQNRRASFDVAIEEQLEAGIVLTSDEIKAIRANRAVLTGAYVKLLRGKNGAPKPVVVGMNLGTAIEPLRTRPLLLHQAEIKHLDDLLSIKGQTAIPMSLTMKRGWAKLTVGIGAGRKHFDKRQLLRERDLEREQRQQLKSRLRGS